MVEQTYEKGKISQNQTTRTTMTCVGLQQGVKNDV
jgi:hypothetical protein